MNNNLQDVKKVWGEQVATEVVDQCSTMQPLEMMQYVGLLRLQLIAATGALDHIGLIANEPEDDVDDTELLKHFRDRITEIREVLDSYFEDDDTVT